MNEVPALAASANPIALLARAYGDVRAGTSESTETAIDPTRTRILDAAFEVFCKWGIQRASVAQVAQRAGVTRITVYRKFESKDALVEEVLLREFRRYFLQFLTDIDEADTAADRVVLGFVGSLRAISGNPLIGGLLESEPGLFVGTLISDHGRTLAAVTQFVAGQLAQEQEAGNVSADIDIELVAEMMVRISASFLTVPSPRVDMHDDAQLASIARQFIVPMLEPRGTK
nr:TetR/AcrR family transcriptional regulator [Aldersonia kunmingensis]